MMSRTIYMIGVFLVFLNLGALAQPNQLQLARNAVGKLQVAITSKADKKRQFDIITEGLKAIDVARTHKKTRKWSETWAINAYLNSYRAIISETPEESEKFYSQALVALDTAKSLDKELTNSQLINAATHNIYIKKQEKGNIAFRESDYPTAFSILSETSDFYVTDTTLALNTAIAAQYIKQNDDAMKYFKRAKDNGIINPGVYQSLAVLYAANLETELAIKTLEDGITKNPGSILLRNDYLNILLDSERYTKALEVVKSRLAAQPSDRLYYIYGFLLQQANELSKAETAYKQALNINQNNFEALYQLGLVYLEAANKLAGKPSNQEYAGSLGKAEMTFVRAYDINPNDRATIELLIEIYKRTDQSEKVRTLQQKLDEF